jgi:hypothetical protein
MRHSLFASVFTALALAAPVTAFAQSSSSQTPAAGGVEVSGLTGFGTVMDDEGSLGGGPMVGASIGMFVHPRVRVGVDVMRVQHSRDLEFRAWEGTPLFVMARGEYISEGNGRVHGIVGGGIGWMRYRGSTTEGPIFAPGINREGPRVTTRYSADGLAVDVNGGIRIDVTPRWSITPQGRFTHTEATRGIQFLPEPPLWFFRAEAAIGYRW